jgi:uncharacterized protein (UPF0335 family)
LGFFEVSNKKAVTEHKNSSVGERRCAKTAKQQNKKKIIFQVFFFQKKKIRGEKKNTHKQTKHKKKKMAPKTNKRKIQEVDPEESEHESESSASGTSDTSDYEVHVDIVGNDQPVTKASSSSSGQPPAKAARSEPMWKTMFDSIHSDNLGKPEAFGQIGNWMTVYIGYPGNDDGKWFKMTFLLPPGLVATSKEGKGPRLSGLGDLYSNDLSNGDPLRGKRCLNLMFGKLPEDVQRIAPGLSRQHQEFIERIERLTVELNEMYFNREYELSLGGQKFDAGVKVALDNAAMTFAANTPYFGTSFVLLKKPELVQILMANGHDEAEAKEMILNSGATSNDASDEDTDLKALQRILELTKDANEARKKQVIKEEAFKSWVTKARHIGYITGEPGNKIMYLEIQGSSSWPDRAKQAKIQKEKISREDVGNPEHQLLWDAVGDAGPNTEGDIPRYYDAKNKPLLQPGTGKVYNDLVGIRRNGFLREEVLKPGMLVQCSIGMRIAFKKGEPNAGTIKAVAMFGKGITVHYMSEESARLVARDQHVTEDYGFADVPSDFFS